MASRKAKTSPKSKEAQSPEPAEAKDAPAETAAPSGKRRNDGFRETIESIVIAFVLAFLFRTFEAEAFVIPTGSMAETLYGRHKDVTCEKCNTHFRVSASDEIEEGSGIIAVDWSDGSTPRIVNFALCPNCRYPNNVLDNLAFVGDRILVNKFPYEFSDPKRFDVVVFKYPEEPKTNYIKRLVGLPGETIKIDWGDLYARKDDTEAFEILRKPPEKQRRLQIPVYDNDKPARELLEAGWPERWAAVAKEGEQWKLTPNGWTNDAKNRTFQFDEAQAGGDGWQWLRYRHIIPYADDWQRVLNGQPVGDPPPQLITDFSSYNSGISVGDARQSERSTGDLFPEPPADTWGVHWVGDLTLSCDVEIQKPQGELLLELVEGERSYRCRIDLTTGKAALEYVDISFNDNPIPLPATTDAQTPLKAAGTYSIDFSNFYDRLLLWIEGDLIDFGEAGGMGPPVTASQRHPTNRDLAPVGIAARDASVTISHLNVTRDIYYLSCSKENDGNGKYAQVDFRAPTNLADMRTFLSDPDKAFNGLNHYQGYRDMLPSTFELGEDEFFVLGDNSARSKDSRLWETGRIHNRGGNFDPDAHHHAVPRDLLIGKAFFIYWPHGIPFLNNGRGIPIWYYSQPVAVQNGHGDWRPVQPQGPGGPMELERSNYPSLTVPFYPQWRRWQRIE